MANDVPSGENPNICAENPDLCAEKSVQNQSILESNSDKIREERSPKWSNS